ncbi:serine/threonine-protein kinase [Lapillicoccus jejuensis]|uniref:non-specific serine/threonine protein kinase n=1 Tax=Lapillicoccus jejuensis TaxID=402171 RepID=A0A542DYU6_9MICO|nr:serine/threonine-protein kinase [Lapillicoccus jejuensis]TQJ08257.1 protein kinase-like protein [Lapillicoccus jejuensis]
MSTATARRPADRALPSTTPSTTPSTPVVADDLDGLPVRDPEPGGELLPGYTALDRLGVGQRCETWLAWSAELWHPVVLKLPRLHQLDHPRARASLRREAVALFDGHPVLPRLVADGADEPVPYVAVELLSGECLADLVEDGPRPGHEVASLGAQLLAGLRHLHRRGLAHLDVKTENVLLVGSGGTGVPRLVDLGSARSIGREQPPGKPVGTLGYAAPEMEACAPLSAAMDLYGLGTVLAELLTGLPFPDGAGAAVAGLDDPVAAVVLRLLDDDPGERGRSDEVLVALAALAGDLRPWPEWADDLLVRAGAPA